MKATRAAARELASDEYGEYGEYGEDSEHGDESGEDVDKVNFVLSIKEETLYSQDQRRVDDKG